MSVVVSQRVKPFVNNILVLFVIVITHYSGNTLAEWTEWQADAEASYTFDDNINHAMFSSAEESDHVWQSVLSAGRVFQLGHHTRFFSNVFLDGLVHQHFEKLNQLNTGVSLAVRHKFGFGPYQPWVRGSVNNGYIFSRSRIRGSYVMTAGIDIGKALHERLDVSLSYRFDYRNSNENQKVNANKLINAGIEAGKLSDVFNIHGHSIGIQLNALLTQQWVLVLGYNYRVGDVVSSNNPGLIPQVSTIVDAIVIDDALSGWAYRSDAETHRYSVDANYAFLKGHASFNLGYEHKESFSGPFVYRSNLFRVNFSYSF